MQHNLQATAPAHALQCASRLKELVYAYAHDMHPMASNPEHLQGHHWCFGCLLCYPAHVDQCIQKWWWSPAFYQITSSMETSGNCLQWPSHGSMLTLSSVWVCSCTSGTVSHLIAPMKAKAARFRGVIWQRQHTQSDAPSFTKHSGLALCYKCKWRGFHTPTGEATPVRADLQSVYSRFLRHICGAKYAPSATILEEQATALLFLQVILVTADFGVHDHGSC